MSDVEGVAQPHWNRIGGFCGRGTDLGHCIGHTVRISPVMTGIALGSLVVFGLGLRGAFRVVRPIFRERAQITAEVSGRTTELHGGVRVVKGYHGEGFEHEVFSGGVERLLQNAFRLLRPATAVISLSSSVLMGLVGASVIFIGTRQILAGKLTLGGFLTYAHIYGLSSWRC